MAQPKAVIFDLGGVVMGSPLHAIAAYERAVAIPSGFVNRHVVATGAPGAWSRLERGEVSLDAFYPLFDAECEAAGYTVSARAMMERIAVEAQPRPRMLAAIRSIRARGLRTAALTNNWIADGTRERDWLGDVFEVVVESALEGIRKPDPRIYQIALKRLGVAATETVFLDDIGRNLKPARALGMITIKVESEGQALGDLSQALGFALDDA
ncbi:MAG: haloacid dehalogenase superfamily protein subfamily variant 3 with third motif having or [Deltaproteobacteria bacterium]|nr:haloacid dehalogenase superfamily protein subfamily variant 3 with third motif having or [Deltaproteobacteria bacterium]